jgi:hypothetical protein
MGAGFRREKALKQIRFDPQWADFSYSQQMMGLNSIVNRQRVQVFQIVRVGSVPTIEIDFLQYQIANYASISGVKYLFMHRIVAIKDQPRVQRYILSHTQSPTKVQYLIIKQVHIDKTAASLKIRPPANTIFLRYKLPAMSVKFPGRQSVLFPMNKLQYLVNNFAYIIGRPAKQFQAQGSHRTQLPSYTNSEAK